MTMLIFLGVYFVVYGGMHVYLYAKLTALLPNSSALLTIAFTLLVIAPVLIIVLENLGYAAHLKWLAQVSYLWMGFAFLLFFISIALDVYQIALLRGSQWTGFNARQWMIPSAIGTPLVAVVVAMIATGYGWWAAQQIKIEKLEIHSPKLQSQTRPLRMVQISDVHLGMLTDPQWLQRLVATIEGLRPDVIVSTGDLLDMQPNDLEHLIQGLARLQPPLGKFAVTGNHEAFAGIDASRDLTQRAGFRLLSFESIQLTNDITLAGIDDPMVQSEHTSKAPSENELLQSISPQQFVILLKHQPRISTSARDLVDLQLSGHIHGGQIAPFNLLTWLSYRVSTGLTHVSDRMQLYVSRGTGVWGPPIRFLADPEVTLIEIGAASPRVH